MGKKGDIYIGLPILCVEGSFLLGSEVSVLAGRASLGPTSGPTGREIATSGDPQPLEWPDVGPEVWEHLVDRKFWANFWRVSPTVGTEIPLYDCTRAKSC